jgi:precorrin isomerase
MGENVVYACGDLDMPNLTRMADEILERGKPL